MKGGTGEGETNKTRLYVVTKIELNVKSVFRAGDWQRLCGFTTFAGTGRRTLNPRIVWKQGRGTADRDRRDALSSIMTLGVKSCR